MSRNREFWFGQPDPASQECPVQTLNPYAQRATAPSCRHPRLARSSFTTVDGSRATCRHHHGLRLATMPGHAASSRNSRSSFPNAASIRSRAWSPCSAAANACALVESVIAGEAWPEHAGERDGARHRPGCGQVFADDVLRRPRGQSGKRERQRISSAVATFPPFLWRRRACPSRNGRNAPACPRRRHRGARRDRPSSSGTGSPRLDVVRQERRASVRAVRRTLRPFRWAHE